MTPINKQNNKAFSLLITMLLFVALTVVGLAVMRKGVLSEKQAINIQEKSVTFHAAQSANNAVIATMVNTLEGIITNSIDKVTNVSNNFRNHNQGYKTCVDGKGNVLETCGTGFEGGLLAKTTIYYRGCRDGNSCQGYSADVGSEVSCHAFELKGQGFFDTDSDGNADVNESRTDINQWVIKPAESCK